MLDVPEALRATRTSGASSRVTQTSATEAPDVDHDNWVVPMPFGAVTTMRGDAVIVPVAAWTGVASNPTLASMATLTNALEAFLMFEPPRYFGSSKCRWPGPGKLFSADSRGE